VQSTRRDHHASDQSIFFVVLGGGEGGSGDLTGGISSVKSSYKYTIEREEFLLSDDCVNTFLRPTDRLETIGLRVRLCEDEHRDVSVHPLRASPPPLHRISCSINHQMDDHGSLNAMGGRRSCTGRRSVLSLGLRRGSSRHATTS